MKQTTNTVLLIRPGNFVFNTQTAASNAFQHEIKNETAETIKQKVFAEFELFAEKLKSKGISVFIFNDTEQPQKPDAIFPNNWISFHADGTAILYPLCAPNRRTERRMDIIDELKKKNYITHLLDLSVHEKENKFLEGTGSIVFDHINKIAYACLSARTNKELFINLCAQLNYKPIYFNAYDKNGQEIYHTNVMMCIGEKFAVVCRDSITAAKEAEAVIDSLRTTNHEVIEITFEQMNSFAGNMLALHDNQNKNIIVLSENALMSLTSAQKTALEKYGELLAVGINTTETIGGGSARCMIAEIF